jgi:hypothetical protein
VPATLTIHTSNRPPPLATAGIAARASSAAGRSPRASRYANAIGRPGTEFPQAMDLPRWSVEEWNARDAALRRGASRDDDKSAPQACKDCIQVGFIEAAEAMLVEDDIGGLRPQRGDSCDAMSKS